MPPFQYTPYQDPYSNTIAQLIAHSADPQAEAAQRIAAANAQATQIGAQAWGGAVQGITKAGVGMMNDILEAQRQAPIIAKQKLELQQAQELEAGRQYQRQLIAASQSPQLGPEDAGPRLPSVIDPQTGQVDAQLLKQGLDAGGFGHISPDLVKSIDGYNDTVLKQQQIKDNIAKQQADLQKQNIINTAHKAQAWITAVDGGMDPDRATNMVTQPGLYSSGDPKQVDQFKTSFSNLPFPDQYAAAQMLVKEGARYDDSVVIPKGGTLQAKHFDVTLGTGEAEPVKTREVEIRQPDGSIIKKIVPDVPGTQFTSAAPLGGLDEQLYRAIATGDTATADRIKQTLTDMANAKKDPATTALVNELRTINVDTAKERLDKLKRENAPLDISPDVKTTVASRQYIDLSTYTADQRDRARQAAAASNVMPISKEQADAVQQIDNARFNQRSIRDQIKGLLPTGPAGRGAAALTVPVQQILQTDDRIGAFKTWRSAAIQSMRAMAGSKGLRINQAEIAQAIENDIPELTDTVGVAQQKLANIETMLENAEKSILVRDRSADAAHPGGVTTATPATPITVGGFTVRVK